MLHIFFAVILSLLLWQPEVGNCPNLSPKRHFRYFVLRSVKCLKYSFYSLQFVQKIRFFHRLGNFPGSIMTKILSSYNALLKSSISRSFKFLTRRISIALNLQTFQFPMPSISKAQLIATRKIASVLGFQSLGFPMPRISSALSSQSLESSMLSILKALDSQCFEFSELRIPNTSRLLNILNSQSAEFAMH